MLALRPKAHLADADHLSKQQQAIVTFNVTRRTRNLVSDIRSIAIVTVSIYTNATDAADTADVTINTWMIVVW